MTYSKTCVDCNCHFDAQRNHAKRCALCRAMAGLKFIGTYAEKKCLMCEVKFAPLTRNDAFCGACAVSPASYGEVDCGFCKQPRRRAMAEINVCNECARVPTYRGKVLRGIQKRIDQQVAAEPESAAARAKQEADWANAVI